MAQQAYVVSIGYPTPNMADWELNAIVQPDMNAADPEGQARNDVAQTLEDLKREGFDIRGLQITGVRKLG